jgi:uncharacterized protein (TIGR02145 family)
MHLSSFSLSRLLSAGIFLCLISITAISCKKNDSQPPLPTAPVVTTAALTNVSFNAATAGGSIVSDGGASITASGVVWSKTNATPTLADSVVAGTTATGIFTSDLTGLEDNASYYVRAFATNSVGTGYGNVVKLNTTNDTNKVRFTYNGEEVVYGIIISQASGRKWLDRNLGAKQVATAYNDWQAYGDLFQWGRPDDGHQVITWTADNANENTSATIANGTIETIATSDIPGMNKFIIPPYDFPLDWRDDNNRNRWATSPQGPCPDGWHVPTIDEWLAEISTAAGGTAASGGMTARDDAYSQLKITIAGFLGIDGPGSVSFGQVGRIGHYWTSTDRNNTYDGLTDAKDLRIGVSGINQGIDYKVTAKSVRCIKD